MDRKKILRRVAVACGAVLLVCTAVSTYVYDALLPRIEVYVDAPAMDIEEKLVLTTDKPLRSGTVVSILNPEVWQK